MNDTLKILYNECKKAYKKKEIPVGAIILKNGKVIAKAHNDRQSSHNVFGHAEIKAILKAEKKLKDWRLDECEMLVSLEPCDMCKTIIEETRIKKVAYIIPKNSINKKNKKVKYQQTNVCNNDLKKFADLFDSFFINLRQK